MSITPIGHSHHLSDQNSEEISQKELPLAETKIEDTANSALLNQKQSSVFFVQDPNGEFVTPQLAMFAKKRTIDYNQIQAARTAYRNGIKPEIEKIQKKIESVKTRNLTSEDEAYIAALELQIKRLENPPQFGYIGTYAQHESYTKE